MSRDIKDFNIWLLRSEYHGSEDAKHLRFGQWFVKKYVNGLWPELFYEKDNTKAFDIVYRAYANEMAKNQALKELKEVMDKHGLSIGFVCPPSGDEIIIEQHGNEIYSTGEWWLTAKELKGE